MKRETGSETRKRLRDKQKQENMKTKIDISVAHTMEASIRKGITQRTEWTTNGALKAHK